MDRLEICDRKLYWNVTLMNFLMVLFNDQGINSDSKLDWTFSHALVFNISLFFCF